MGSIISVGKKKKDRSKGREQLGFPGKISMQNGTIRILVENLQQQQQEHLTILWEILKVVNSMHLQIHNPQNELLHVVKGLVEKANMFLCNTITSPTEIQRKSEMENVFLMDTDQAADALLQLSGQLKLFRDLQRTVEDSILKKNLEVNIQAHGSPGEFWEQELESMLFVVEMKNKHLQEQRKKLTEMEKLKERNRLLEDQLARVISQNEELRAHMEKSPTLNNRQPSTAEMELPRTLEEETPVTDRLSYDTAASAERASPTDCHHWTVCQLISLPSVDHTAPPN
ncbi:coiled-coil domain-containing protein 69-like isoform X1 [Arapaima gigas]